MNDDQGELENARDVILRRLRELSRVLRENIPPNLLQQYWRDLPIQQPQEQENDPPTANQFQGRVLDDYDHFRRNPLQERPPVPMETSTSRQAPNPLNTTSTGFIGNGLHEAPTAPRGMRTNNFTETSGIERLPRSQTQTFEGPLPSSLRQPIANGRITLTIHNPSLPQQQGPPGNYTQPVLAQQQGFQEPSIAPMYHEHVQLLHERERLNRRLQEIERREQQLEYLRARLASMRALRPPRDRSGVQAEHYAPEIPPDNYYFQQMPRHPHRQLPTQPTVWPPNYSAPPR
ncbi:hypothetical protein F5Y02DRAFT_426870 [Annulohypoxylon stygium]|nr:hypothetical protein F5Y02DRAFT_426870 [Annulohypoxylon stygium]